MRSVVDRNDVMRRTPLKFSASSASYCCVFNPLNAELNPIRHLLALLEARHILHVSRIRVKLLKRSAGSKLL